MKPVRIGIVGCGNISNAYLRTVAAFPVLECIAVTDLDNDRARDKAAEFGIPNVLSLDGLLAHPDVEIVVNLTTPQSHAEIALAAVAAGKHVFNEKPLTVLPQDAANLLELARKFDVRVGGAPGTFLGGGLQTCRKLIDEGMIGKPIGANAFMLGRGHESWHPAPEFYYAPGGGPLLDMGPYYLTALISLLGGIKRVTGSAAITIPERTITSQPKYGKKIMVDTPDHIAGTIEFASGAIGAIVMSFSVMHATVPPIQIFGTEGTLTVPDPNSLGGPVTVRLAGETEWREVPLTHNNSDGYTMWGIGVADMAYAIRSGRPHRASGDLTYQVLRTMHGILGSARDGSAIEINGTIDRPAPLSSELPDGVLDL